MGLYLDNLTTQFDEIVGGMDEILNRAADESRELNADEQKLVERDSAKAEELKKAIEYHAGLELTRSKVEDVRAKVPAAGPRRENVQVVEREQKIEEIFPTMGEYIVTVARAMRGDKEAGELIARATAHQTTADNPGLIPRPIVGPVITAVDNERPFINSISRKALPAGAFDRPVITQHVGVGKQAAEKDLTESRKLIVGKLPVTATTYAGHLNISRQDIKWSQPAIMQLVAEDFVHEYATETDVDAATQFVATPTGTAVTIATLDAAGITAGIFEAAANVMSTSEGAPLPDTFWVAPDVWGALGSLVNNNGTLVFPSVTPTSAQGNLLGIKLVVDPAFAAGTAILGPARYAEWFEDVDGLIQVAEPDVLGQLVGYAGYGAFLNTRPDLFTKLTLPAPTVAKTTTK
jgi:HK97 family phage major capsid protein